MRTEITINGSNAPDANYVPWTPAPCRISLLEAGGLAGPITVTLQNGDTSQGGQVVFYTAPDVAPQNVLQLELPTDGSPVDFFVGGKFSSASKADKDASIEVVETAGGGVLSVTQLMVRVRKDVETLTDDERDRFVSALATLNDRGLGQFSDFRNMHRDQAALDQAHGDAGFLPWHRAYLLDLERELQNIDPSVALHYWRFDKPAPKLFTRDFMGETQAAPLPTGPQAPPGAAVSFSPTNPLRFWVTDNVPGIPRSRYFDPASAQGASGRGGPVLNEQATLKLGEAQGSLYEDFLPMEIQPHGAAHVSFAGPISVARTAPRDPLFFLLHSNVDRLWAMWQYVYRRFDTTSAATYSPLGRAVDHEPDRIGHYLEDTLWPWDQDMNPPRPSNAPGGNLAASPVVSAPGPSPTLLQMVDFQGKLNRDRRLGFDYDDIPYEV
jgi:tyrosinase